MNSKLLQGFRLSGWLVEPLKGQITGAAGVRHLTPKAVDLLLRLAERPCQLQTREELLEKVWGQGNGSDEALGHAVSEIRHAFDDQYDAPFLIQTLPKRGYRLLCEPEFDNPPRISGEPGLSQHGWWQRLLRHGVVQAAAAYLVAGWLLLQVADTTFSKIGLPGWSEKFVTFMVIGGFPLVVLIAWSFEFVGGRMEHDRGDQGAGLLQGLERNYVAIFIAYGVAALGAGAYQWSVGFKQIEPVASEQRAIDLLPIEDNSIAVLRLATFDEDPITKAFSDGLSEDILDGLARIPGLFVSARGDSWSLAPHSTSDAVRRRLRVANYIEGSVRFLDDRLRVVVQLIDSENGFHLFSRSFEIDLASTAEMQREVTELVVANLKLAVDTDSLPVPAPSSATHDRDAYILYMLGREAIHRPVSAANIDEAINYFNDALKIDSAYPAAHAGLCSAYVSLYDLQRDTASIGKAEAACGMAQRVAPQLPVVLNSLGQLYRNTGKPDAAENAYLATLGVDERNADALVGLARIRHRQQRYEEAEDLMRRAIALQPGNWVAINTLGGLYFRMGQFVDAANEYRKVVFLNPDNHVALGNLASTSLMSGDFEVARDTLLDALELEENATLVANLGIAYYYLGELDESIATLNHAVELVPNDESNLIALADALQAAQRVPAAREAYERARDLAAGHVEIASDSPDALMWLAWTTAMTGDLARAGQLAQRAVDIDPAYPYSHYYKALVALRAGDKDTAIRSCERALETGYPAAMLAAEPILEELRGDSRFARLLAEHNVGEEE